MKYFSKEKFIDAMKTYTEITEEELQDSLYSWVNDADGKPVEELESEGLLIHPRWITKVDEDDYDEDYDEWD